MRMNTATIPVVRDWEGFEIKPKALFIKPIQLE
jgi:hypothetical protein